MAEIDDLVNAIKLKQFAKIEEFAKIRPNLEMSQTYFRSYQIDIFDALIQTMDQKILKLLNLSIPELNTLFVYMRNKKLSFDLVKFLLDNGVQLSGVDSLLQRDDRMAGAAICYVRDPKIMKLMIENGAKYDILSEYISAPTFEDHSVKGNRIKSIDVLLDAGADINRQATWARNHGSLDYPLLASYYYLDVFMHLVDRGADLTLKVDGNTIYHIVMYKIMTEQDRTQYAVNWMKMFVYLQNHQHQDVYQQFKLVDKPKKIKKWQNEWFQEMQIDPNKIVWKSKPNEWEILTEQKPNLSTDAEWLDDAMDTTESKTGKWFYNVRDMNGEGQIVRAFSHELLTKIKNKKNPFTNRTWDSVDLRRFEIDSGGGREYYTYEKRKYLVRRGPRGGKYILVRGEKKRI